MRGKTITLSLTGIQNQYQRYELNTIIAELRSIGGGADG